MRLTFKRNISISLILILFCISSAFAGGFTQLPRNFGPVKVGMTTGEFTVLTNVIPEKCAICIEKERFATLDEFQLEKLDISGNGADFFFYDNKLYQISVGPKEKDLFMARQDYESQFGGEAQTITNNGIGILKWEDAGTIITLNYHSQDNEVFSLNIYDWNLKEERDWRESIANEKTSTVSLN